MPVYLSYGTEIDVSNISETINVRSLIFGCQLHGVIRQFDEAQTK